MAIMTQFAAAFYSVKKEGYYLAICSLLCFKLAFLIQELKYTLDLV